MVYSYYKNTDRETEQIYSITQFMKQPLEITVHAKLFSHLLLRFITLAAFSIYSFCCRILLNSGVAREIILKNAGYKLSYHSMKSIFKLCWPNFNR